MKRPEFKQTEGIGYWIYILNFLGVAACISNALFCVFTSANVVFVTDSSELFIYEALWFAVVLEHVFLIINICTTFLISKRPSWLVREIGSQRKYIELRSLKLSKREGQYDQMVEDASVRSKKIDATQNEFKVDGLTLL